MFLRDTHEHENAIFGAKLGYMKGGFHQLVRALVESIEQKGSRIIVNNILPYQTDIEGLHLAGMFSEANYPERSMNDSIEPLAKPT